MTEHPPGKRARQRAATEAEILRVARDHLARYGAAALSLRAIARDLGMVSSGLYRYVTSRDDLLTRLIIDTYTSLAQAVTDAHAAVVTDSSRARATERAPRRHAGGTADGSAESADSADAATAAINHSWRRWEAIASALRAWALQHPHDYALIYGSPVPDYQAPPERTVEAGTQVLGLMVQLLHDAQARGQVPQALVDSHSHTLAADAVYEVDADSLAPMLTAPVFRGLVVESSTLARGLAAWTLLLGAVSSEVFGQLGTVPDADALFRLQLRLAGSLFLLSPSVPNALSTSLSTTSV